MLRDRHRRPQFLLDLLRAQQVEFGASPCSDEPLCRVDLLTRAEEKSFDQTDILLSAAQLKVRRCDLGRHRHLGAAHVHGGDTSLC